MISQRARFSYRQMGFGGRSFLSCVVMIIVLTTSLNASPSRAEVYSCDIDGNGKLGLAEVINTLQYVSGLLAGDELSVLDCGVPSGEVLNPNTLDSDAKRYLLCQHNEIRSQTALGLTDAYGGGKHPVATNMKRLQWDENLAIVASNWAAQCSWDHNDDRTTDYTALLTGDVSGIYVGENIYANTRSPTVFSTGNFGTDYGIAGVIPSWNSESTDWVYGSTKSSSECHDVCGHFTQNVWAQTTKVGCGYYNCSQGISGLSASYKTFVVCNYAQGGNYPTSVYRSGESIDDVCSEEAAIDNTCENGLITPAIYSSGIDYECDVNGDGLLGLEELIDALYVVSGRVQ